MPDVNTGFDLVSQPWIPVLGADGVVRKQSLVQAFSDAPSSVEIVGEVPTQGFAILRVMLAILHRAVKNPVTDVCGPDDAEQWADMRRDWPAVTRRVNDYLAEHRDRFDLFHPQVPFFQVAELRTAKDEVSRLEKLIVDVPNGAPFFTTRLGRGLARISAAEAARWLIHVQAFDASGIRSGAVDDPRVKGGKGYPIGPAWAGQIGGVHLVGPRLADTLMLNLIPASDQENARPGDLPAWERPPLGPTVEQRPQGVVAPTGPVDLYTWQARRVRLVGDRDGVTGLVLALGDSLQGRNRRLIPLEPMTGWRYSPTQTKKIGGITYMPKLHDPSRELWRGLASLLASEVPAANHDSPPRWRAPGVMRWASQIAPELNPDEARLINIRAVGMTYINQQSIVGEMINDQLSVPLALLDDPGDELRTLAVDAVSDTEKAVVALADLAANLVRAAGGDGDDQQQAAKNRAAERGYAELDLLYRQWLASLSRNENPLGAKRRWHATARTVIWRIRGELLEECSPTVWAGRIVRKGPGETGQPDARRILDAAQASIWFERALSKVFPYQSDSDTTAEAALR